MSIRETDLPLATVVDRIRALDAGVSVNILSAVLADQLAVQMHVTRSDTSSVLLTAYLNELQEAAASGVLGFATKSGMVAAAPTVPPTGTIRRVTDDPSDVGGNINGEWRYDPAGPGDHWVKIADSKYDALLDQVEALDVEVDAFAPIAEKIIPNLIEFIDGLRMILRFASGTGRSLGGFSDDSYLNLFKGMRIGLADNRVQIMPTSEPDILHEVLTSNGRVKFRLSASGTKDVNPFAASSGAANPLAADVLHITLYGQSLGEGSESLPPLTTSPTGHRGRMFIRSVRTWKLDAYALTPLARPASEFEVVDLHEAQDGAVGETAASAIVAALRDQLVGPNSGVSRDSGPEILISFAGRGGRRLYELDKAHQNDPTGLYYDTMIDDIRRAKAYAVANGKTFAELGMVFLQGEADNDLKFNDADSPMAYADFIPAWAAAFTQLADDYDADARVITGQAGRLPVFVYQTGGTIVGQAQMVAAATSPDKIVPVGPTYFVPSGKNSSYTSGGLVVHGSEVHLAADGERWWGSLAGKNMYRFLVRRDQNVSLRAILARKVSTDEIDVVFNVPCPPIRLDTTFWPLNTAPFCYAGFRCMTGSGTAQVQGPAVTGVTVVDTDTIRLKLASAVPAGAKVECARLRDQKALSLPVADWRDGATLPNGRASKELAFAGDIRSQIQQHLNEGCFLVLNMTSGTPKTWIGRTVAYTGSQTVITGENVTAEFGSTVTPATAFLVGNSVAIARTVAYGNVFDSDSAKSPLTFLDSTYSVGRVGTHYPLPNPLNAFQDLEVIGA